MKHTYLRQTIIAILAVSTLPAFAQTSQTIYELDPLVITASKVATKASNLVAHTSTISATELALYQGQSALDVLKNEAGFSSYGSGGSDKASNIYLRGYDGKNILILIDGIRYTSVSTGTAALGQLPTDQIERIEVLHGASGAAIYGADASGGVVQVFTKKGNVDGSHIALTLGVGSHEEFRYGVSAGITRANTTLNLAASHKQTDGFNAIALPYASSQRDKDGFETDNISAVISHKFGRMEVGANLLGSKSTTQYDNTWSTSPNIYVDSKNGAASAYLVANYSDNGAVRLSHGQSIDKTTNYADTTKTGTFDTTQTQTNLTLKHALSVGHVIAGAEYLQQELASDTIYQETERTTKSAFVGYQATHGALDGQAFVRHDDNSAFGKQTTYNTGFAYRITPTLRVGTSYATGFRAPTFNELYYPVAWGSGGNPHLKVETSKNSEVFLEYKNNHQRTRLTGYQSKVNDLIVGWTPYNADKAEITGATLTSDWQVGDYVFGAHYDYQEADDVTPDALGNKTKKSLPIRPTHKGGAYIGYIHDSFDIKAEYQLVGDYYRSANHSNKIDGYELVNLSGTYRLNPHISLNGRINNLFNKKYVTNATQGMYSTTYNEDGTNFQTAITFSY